MDETGQTFCLRRWPGSALSCLTISTACRTPGHNKQTILPATLESSSIQAYPASIMNGAPPTTDKTVSLVLKLGQALHRYGAPSHRLEATLATLCSHFSRIGQFFATPTAIFASFGTPEDQKTSLIRVEPGEVDLERMTALDDVVNDLLQGRIDIDQGLGQVDSISSSPPRYGPFLMTMCFGLASGAAARFFGGGALEVVSGIGMGMFIGVLALLAERYPGIGRVFAPAAAFAVSAMAMLGAWIWPALSAYIATVAGLIIISTYTSRMIGDRSYIELHPTCRPGR